MRWAGLVLGGLLLVGCSYSPEEQYRECMGEFHETIWDQDTFEEQQMQLLRYHVICRLSSGMDVTLAEATQTVVLIDDMSKMAQLLLQFD